MYRPPCTCLSVTGLWSSCWPSHGGVKEQARTSEYSWMTDLANLSSHIIRTLREHHGGMELMAWTITYWWCVAMSPSDSPSHSGSHDTPFCSRSLVAPGLQWLLLMVIWDSDQQLFICPEAAGQVTAPPVPSELCPLDLPLSNEPAPRLLPRLLSLPTYCYRCVLWDCTTAIIVFSWDSMSCVLVRCFVCNLGRLVTGFWLRIFVCSHGYWVYYSVNWLSIKWLRLQVIVQDLKASCHWEEPISIVDASVSLSFDDSIVELLFCYCMLSRCFSTPLTHSKSYCYW